MITTPHAKRAAFARILADFPGTGTEAQCTRLREALAVFSVSTFEAMRYLDLYDPRARVCQLRKRGHRIDTHFTKVQTESGDLHRVGVYVISPEPIHEGQTCLTF
jgi:Helix-turn-helix domain